MCADPIQPFPHLSLSLSFCPTFPSSPLFEPPRRPCQGQGGSEQNGTNGCMVVLWSLVGWTGAFLPGRVPRQPRTNERTNEHLFCLRRHVGLLPPSPPRPSLDDGGWKYSRPSVRPSSSAHHGVCTAHAKQSSLFTHTGSGRPKQFFNRN